jgi:hypothetical protein
MAYIAKLVCNRLGWTVPSGLDAKNENAQSQLFESDYHFGFEEWLFNKAHQATLKGKTCNFGYIECFKNSNEFPKEIYLTTKLYKNSNYPNQQETQRLIGKLTGVERLTDNNFRSIFLQHENLITTLEGNLRNALGTSPKLSAALSVLRKAKDERWLFNVKYENAYRYKLPEENENWDYLNTPHGYNQALPKNFSIKQIEENQVETLLNANGLEMERVI